MHLRVTTKRLEYRIPVLLGSHVLGSGRRGQMDLCVQRMSRGRYVHTIPAVRHILHRGNIAVRL